LLIETLALESALKHLLSDEDREMLCFEQVFEQIQDEIENGGGIADKEIDTLIAAYRYFSL
jgi:hypothetical protein